MNPLPTLLTILLTLVLIIPAFADLNQGLVAQTAMPTMKAVTATTEQSMAQA
jgi:hypothetical protein